MNGKQAKRARAVAHAEAVRRGLWKQGESYLFGKWWRRLIAWLFPKRKKQYMDRIGRWYKSTLKMWSRQAYTAIHDRDFLALQRARVKIQKQHAREKMQPKIKVVSKPSA
jgi:hypothetical protein